MNDETTQTDQQTDVVSEPTLDDIISEYNVPTNVSQEPQRPAQQEPQSYQMPASFDPLDEASARQFAENVGQSQQVLSQQLRDVSSKLTQLEQERAELQVEADISKAVEAVSEGLDIDPMVARVYLEVQAREKPAFRSMWENRQNDPKTLQKALNAMKKDIGDKFQAKLDPELTANLKAVQQSQQSMAGRNNEAPENSIEDALKGAKSEGERQRIWQNIVHGGH